MIPNFASDAVAGFNVIPSPCKCRSPSSTSDGAIHTANDPRALIRDLWNDVTAPYQVLPNQPGGKPVLSNHFVQIQRMGNALINELLIGTGDKDKFSMSEPDDDAQFANYLLDPLLARVINAAYGGQVPIPEPPRLDLAPLVFYTDLLCPGCQNLQSGPRFPPP
jgi:hypothetical protein